MSPPYQSKPCRHHWTFFRKMNDRDYYSCRCGMEKTIHYFLGKAIEDRPNWYEMTEYFKPDTDDPTKVWRTRSAIRPVLTPSPQEV